VQGFSERNDVFHDPAVFAAERARLYEEGWFFAGTRDALPLRYPVGEQAYRVAATAGGLRAWREEAPQRSLPVEAIGPYVFVHGGRPRESLRDYLGPQAATLERLGALAGGLLFEERFPIGANWKLVLAGGIEDYHLPAVHGRSVGRWRKDPAPPELFAGGHSSYGCPAGVGPAMRLFHGLVAGTTPVEEVFGNHLVFPNLLTIQLWGLVHVTTFLPLGPARSERVTRIYEHDPPRGLSLRRLRGPLVWTMRRGMGVTFAEDRWIVEEAQAGTRISQHFRRGPTHSEEARVGHFLGELERRLGTNSPTR